jgi:hypothetical protein
LITPPQPPFSIFIFASHFAALLAEADFFLSGLRYADRYVTADISYAFAICHYDIAATFSPLLLPDAAGALAPRCCCCYGAITLLFAAQLSAACCRDADASAATQTRCRATGADAGVCESAAFERRRFISLLSPVDFAISSPITDFVRHFRFYATSAPGFHFRHDDISPFHAFIFISWLRRAATPLLAVFDSQLPD